MKKKILALLLGGGMAVGALFMQVPATVQAVDNAVKPYCDWKIAPHIKSYEVTTVDGQLTVTIDINDFEGKCTGFSLFAFEKQLGSSGSPGSFISEKVFADEWNGGKGHPKEISLFSKQESGTYTFTGLAGGKTYYVYCCLYDSHSESNNEDDAHHMGALYLGSGTPTVSSGSGSSGNDDEEAISYEDVVASQIEEAPSGSTIVMEEGISALSNSVMKELLAKGDVSLKLEFTYKDKEYVIIIPAGAALDNDIPWYGPLYLAQHFGNRAGMGDTYEVQPGDSLSKIAAANQMTLKQLLAKNPQIKDPNKISVGQKIKR